MLTESYFVSVAGPPLANNTAIAKDAGIYEHTLHPSHSTTATLKKSSAPRNGLAVSDTHIFAAQEEKSTVHVYPRAKGNQEALVTFSERIRSIALQDDVLFLGTQEGRLIIWEVSLPNTNSPHVPVPHYSLLIASLDLHRQASNHACLSRPGGDLHSCYTLPPDHGV